MHVRWQRVRPLLPWLSLLTGVGGALLMNRTPGRAWIVVVAAVVGWSMLVVFNIVERGWTDAPARSLSRRGARYALVLSNQVAIQQALLFPLPFYVRAAHVHPGHLAFFALYATALVVALWDPLFARALVRPAASVALQAWAAFVGLDMVLPVLGLSNERALLVAGLATAIAVPLGALLARTHVTEPTAPAGLWRARALAGVGALAIVVAAHYAGPWVPPAPLELVSVAIGTRVDDHELVDGAAVLEAPAQLACHSAIKAPLGLKDALVHVWDKDGRAFDRVPLDVRGGRDAGFRTWSIEHPTGAGVYTCSVETASGQVLGEAHVTVR